MLPAVMGAALLALGTWSSVPVRGEIIDRIAAIVGSEAITLSDVRDEQRVQAFLNGAELAATADGGMDVLRMLVNRRLVHLDLAMTPFLVAEDSDVSELMRELREHAFIGGKDFAGALAHYGLAEEVLLQHLRDQISFERYVAFRFKTGQQVGRAEIEEHYRDVYGPRQATLGLPAERIDAVAADIEEDLLEAKATELLELRLKELRLLHRIEILGLGIGGGP